MSLSKFQVIVRPAEESELDLLERQFSPNNLANPQYMRYEVQRKKEGVYLIAWHDQTPIGHFLVRWSGPNDAPVTQYVDISRCAYLEGGVTIDTYRRRGVATTIIQEAERLAKEQGCTHIGLEVGSTDNPEARRLYEKLGYIDWGYGEFKISWDFIDKNGKKRIDSEIVIYMQKKL